MIAAHHFTWPILSFYLSHTIFWKVFLMLQPDLHYWLEVVAVIVFLEGLVEIALTWYASRPGRGHLV